VPHVVLQAREGSDGRALLEAWARHYEPFLDRDGDRIVKADRFFRERGGGVALIEMVVVDRGFTQKFFIQIAARSGDVTVRLEPLSDPEKTAGVRAALARVAERIVAATGCAWGATNIPGDLRR
jgi:hypothetical protein